PLPRVVEGRKRPSVSPGQDLREALRDRRNKFRWKCVSDLCGSMFLPTRKIEDIARREGLQQRCLAKGDGSIRNGVQKATLRRVGAPARNRRSGRVPSHAAVNVIE